MKKRVYVVLENTWSYNDNYYYQPENGGGHPLGVFVREEDAIREAKHFGATAIARYVDRLGEYAGCENMTEGLGEKRARAAYAVLRTYHDDEVPSPFETWADDFYGQMPKTVDPEAARQLSELLWDVFYEVVPVEMDFSVKTAVALTQTEEEA